MLLTKVTKAQTCFKNITAASSGCNFKKRVPIIKSEFPSSPKSCNSNWQTTIQHLRLSSSSSDDSCQTPPSKPYAKLFSIENGTSTEMTVGQLSSIIVNDPRHLQDGWDIYRLLRQEPPKISSSKKLDGDCASWTIQYDEDHIRISHTSASASQIATVQVFISSSYLSLELRVTILAVAKHNLPKTSFSLGTGPAPDLFDPVNGERHMYGIHLANRMRGGAFSFQQQKPTSPRFTASDITSPSPKDEQPQSQQPQHQDISNQRIILSNPANAKTLEIQGNIRNASLVIINAPNTVVIVHGDIEDQSIVYGVCQGFEVRGNVSGYSRVAVTCPVIVASGGNAVEWGSFVDPVHIQQENFGFMINLISRQ